MLRPNSVWDETLRSDGCKCGSALPFVYKFLRFQPSFLGDVRSAGSAKKQKPNKANTNDTQIP